MKPRILVTGGAGFIGSHMCVALASEGIDFVIIDNFSNSSKKIIKNIELITNRPITLVEGDVKNKALLMTIFSQYGITAVIHFAALKSVAESVSDPLRYYSVNVFATMQLLEAMAAANVKTLVFSSSATVYGATAAVPYTENSQLGPVNPYGETKLVIENLLRHLSQSDPAWRIACLRYFNPVGAHESGLIGENPVGRPNNLMPYIGQVASGALPKLKIFGGDYPSIDGTGVRDYIHVMDLVDGHIAALAHTNNIGGMSIFNLGTGKGISVLQMVQAFERATGQIIPYDIIARRDGDLPAYWANADLAEKILGWQPRKNIDQMCCDVWRWQQYCLKRPSNNGMD